jgi:hypothetical protein
MMMLTIHPESPSAASWLSQRQELESRLNRDRANPLAWYWRIRIKLLTFLLARYGAAPHLSTATPRSPAAKCVIQKQESPPLRSQSDIRIMLNRIATANIERRLEDE